MERKNPRPNYPVTPDGRYFVVRGRLCRLANPDLEPTLKVDLVTKLMGRAVDDIQRALGERGPVWWSAGAPDLSRERVKNTVYAGWYAALKKQSRAAT